MANLWAIFQGAPLSTGDGVDNKPAKDCCCSVDSHHVNPCGSTGHEYKSIVISLNTVTGMFNSISPLQEGAYGVIDIKSITEDISGTYEVAHCGDGVWQNKTESQTYQTYNCTVTINYDFYTTYPDPPPDDGQIQINGFDGWYMPTYNQTATITIDDVLVGCSAGKDNDDSDITWVSFGNVFLTIKSGTCPSGSYTIDSTSLSFCGISIVSGGTATVSTSSGTEHPFLRSCSTGLLTTTTYDGSEDVLLINDQCLSVDSEKGSDLEQNDATNIAETYTTCKACFNRYYKLIKCSDNTDSGITIPMDDWYLHHRNYTLQYDGDCYKRGGVTETAGSTSITANDVEKWVYDDGLGCERCLAGCQCSPNQSAWIGTTFYMRDKNITNAAYWFGLWSTDYWFGIPVNSNSTATAVIEYSPFDLNEKHKCYKLTLSNPTTDGNGNPITKNWIGYGQTAAGEFRVDSSSDYSEPKAFLVSAAP